MQDSVILMCCLGGHHCAKVDVLKLYGTTFHQADIWVVRDPGRTFYMSATFGSSYNCSVHVPFIDSGLFGWYYISAPNHGCAASSTSTTQNWFGIKL